MKTRMCRLEFGVNCLADIRFLYHAWDRLWTLEGGVPPHSILVYVTIEDRLPGEQVSLNFHSQPGSAGQVPGASWSRTALSLPATISYPAS